MAADIVANDDLPAFKKHILNRDGFQPQYLFQKKNPYNTNESNHYYTYSLHRHGFVQGNLLGSPW